MEIRDVIHGTIEISPQETLILESAFFQRLRNIKQLGFSENSYPGATHNRYTHSIGAMHLATIVFQNALLSKNRAPIALNTEACARLLAATRIAALLHDVGHGPLSHTTEFAMPKLSELKLGLFSEDRQANHEDYTLKIVLQSSLTPILEKALKSLGIKPIHIACIINEEIKCPDDFFKIDGVNYLPILHQFISSEIDVDRMDYLMRDSYYTGASYGRFDLEWLVSNITHHIKDGACYLALQHKAIYTFDDFLISRFHMFLMVYFHHKSVIFDEILARYLKSEDCNYIIPSDIESYVYFDDYHLNTHLSTSQNEWAKRIYHKNPYKMLTEFHSGIETQNQKAQIEKVKAELEKNNVPYIVKTTTGEFSKYFKKNKKFPIFVRYANPVLKEKFIPLEECTDLFERYSENRSLTRIYIPNES